MTDELALSLPSFKKLVSVVIPIYNEYDTLLELTLRLCDVFANHPGTAWEVIYVNDGSRDGSDRLLSQITQQHPQFTALHLSRNFGHQVAISAGIDYAQGDAVIVMDGDLQDPPELLPQMVAEWQDGYDVVYATRKHREGETPFKLTTAKLFYRMLKKMSDIDIPLDTGDFRLMSRPVVNAFLLMREKNRFIRGMVSWVGFSQTAVYYERDARHHGETKFTFLKMLRFAIDGLLSFSKIPLQWISTLGFIISGISFLAILGVLYATLIMQITLPGWSSLMMGILMLGGIQLICMGMIGEYVARIFDEVRNRPLYFIGKIDSQHYPMRSSLLPNGYQSVKPPIREMILYDTTNPNPAPVPTVPESVESPVGSDLTKPEKRQDPVLPQLG